MKLMGKFLCSRISSLVRGLFLPGSFRIVWNNGSDLLSHRDISIKLLSCNIFENVFCLSLMYLVSSKLFCSLMSYSTHFVAPDELRSKV